MHKGLFDLKLLLLLIIYLCTISCEPDYLNHMPALSRKLVVDGWIENGSFPTVILTYNTPYFSNLDSASFRGLVASRARVIVSDGERFEILTLTTDTSYFPPFVYKGFEIKGEINKTYFLTIEDELDTVYSVTTIPEPAYFDSLWYEAKTDSNGIIKGRITDNEQQKNYYRIFTRIRNKDRRFYPILASTYDDKYFNGKQFTFYLNKGPKTYLKPIEDVMFYKGDTVIVKLTTIDEKSYLFWRSYEEEVINGGNPFAANIKSIESNINNGLGIWCGYATSYKTIVAK